jgi:hypothetical protein
MEWAQEKLDQLESLIQGAIDEALKTPISQSSDDRMKVLFDLNYSVTPVARRLISEYALHARAALDYLVFDLALHNTGAEQRNTQFPIQRSPEKFPWKLDKAAGVRKGIGPLKYLKPEEVALIAAAAARSTPKGGTGRMDRPARYYLMISFRPPGVV